MVDMLHGWRGGFDIARRIAGWAPLVGVLVGGVGVTINAAVDDGDLRVGLRNFLSPVRPPQPSVWVGVGG
jgi:hypothetical protein